MFTLYHQNAELIDDFSGLSDVVEKLDDDTIHIWSVQSDGYDEQRSYSNYYLSADEQNRAQRFHFRKDHDLYVLGRYAARVMLAYYTGVTPESVKITLDSYGKPVCDMNLCFNITHSDTQLLVGFSTSPIGVDIEKVDPKVDVLRIAKSNFSKNEFQKIIHCIKGERTEAFFDIWTKKEALIKGLGKGFCTPLQDFTVTNRNGKVLSEFLCESNCGNWFVRNIDIMQGYKSAYATQNENINLSYFRYY